MSIIVYLFWGSPKELLNFWRIAGSWLCDLKELPWSNLLFFAFIYWGFEDLAHYGLWGDLWGEQIVLVERRIRLVVIASDSKNACLGLRLARKWAENTGDVGWNLIEDGFILVLLVDWLSLDSVFVVKEAWGHDSASEKVLESTLNLVWAIFLLDWLCDRSQNHWVNDWRLFLAWLSEDAWSNLTERDVGGGAAGVGGDASDAVFLLGDGAESVFFGDWDDLGSWNVVIFSLSKLKSNGFDVKAHHSGETVHTEVLDLVALVVTNIEDVTRLLFGAVFLNSISKPSL